VPLLESLGEVISTDILVVGGGFAGLATAIRAKEESAEVEVLIVEKATTGWAGKATMGGGILAFVTPEDSPEEFVKYHVNRIGCYLEDQELLTEYAVESRGLIDDFSTWGVNLSKNEDGSLLYIKHLGKAAPWGLASVDTDMCQRMRKTAMKLGTKFLDKISIVDLLKDGERVVGAVGINLLNGKFIIIKAKATILANGNQNYRIMHQWSSGRGDGIAAAYRAGAEMRNAEFGNFMNMTYKANRAMAAQAEEYMLDAAGNDIAKKYNSHAEIEPDITIQALIGWYKEMQAGNGPISVDRRNYQKKGFLQKLKGTGANRAVADGFWGCWAQKGSTAFNDSPIQSIEPAIIGELSPVKVNHQMATTLPGLFAVGDISISGSAWTGAVPSPPARMRGSGLMNALLGAKKAGPAAVKYATNGPTDSKIDYYQVKALKDRMFAPLERDNGVAAIELIHKIQEAISPFKYSGYKSQKRMEEALKLVMDVQAQIPALKAKDAHELVGCNEAVSMALAAEMFYRASMERKESRGWFAREDYPEVDNKNWLKWIILKDNNGKMGCSTEDVPIEKYPYKPF
jgi:succinate dehydrogenase/fumarate reductase flavoprotein subunit